MSAHLDYSLVQVELSSTCSHTDMQYAALCSLAPAGAWWLVLMLLPINGYYAMDRQMCNLACPLLSADKDLIALIT